MNYDEEELTKLIDLNYAAPELILKVEKDEKVDLWSIGCLFY